MGDIRRNISRLEMACECGCGFAACDTELMDLLQELVDEFQAVINAKGRVRLQITGPNRCREHNETVQKAAAVLAGQPYAPYSSRSPHIRGLAADFKLWVDWATGERTQISPASVHDTLLEKYPDRHGFGLYDNRNHADIRPNPARW